MCPSALPRFILRDQELRTITGAQNYVIFLPFVQKQTLHFLLLNFFLPFKGTCHTIHDRSTPWSGSEYEWGRFSCNIRWSRTFCEPQRASWWALCTFFLTCLLRAASRCFLPTPWPSRLSKKSSILWRKRAAPNNLFQHLVRPWCFHVLWLLLLVPSLDRDMLPCWRAIFIFYFVPLLKQSLVGDPIALSQDFSDFSQTCRIPKESEPISNKSVLCTSCHFAVPS